MAEVYEVRDPSTGERYALKLLMDLTTSVRRFNREFEALTRLNHPNIVRVFRYGFLGRNPWIAMELLEGHQLQPWVNRTGTPGDPQRTDEVIRVGHLLATALGYVHARGLVHRDIKSANVTVLPDGRVKLLDFGTAHLIDPLERITQDGDFVGTFSYAAPEQILGTKIDGRADLYALGVLLYRLATGRRPFRSNDAKTLARMHLNEAPTAPSSLVPALPDALNDLILALLAKRASDRPQRAEDVARALEKAAGRPMNLGATRLGVRSHRSLAREPEHRELWASLEPPAPGQMVFVLEGDAIERRSFLRQVAEDAPRRGHTACLLRPEPQPMLGVGMWMLSLLGEANVDDPPARTTARAVLSALEDAPPNLRRDAIESAIPEVVQALLASPKLLLIEPMAAFDSESIGVLQALAGALLRARAPIPFVVAGATEGTVSALHRVAAQAQFVRLAPLDANGTAIAIGQLLHRRSAPSDVARRIHGRTGGRPTAIAHLVRDLVERGALTAKDGDGQRITLEAGVLSSDAAADALDGIPTDLRHALAAIHLAGGRTHRRALAAALGWSLAETQLLCTSGIDGGLLSAKGDDLLATDPTLAQLAASRIDPRRHTAIGRGLAEHLPPGPLNDDQVRLLLVADRVPLAVHRGIPCAADLLERGQAGDALELLEALAREARGLNLPNAIACDLHLLRAAAARTLRPLDAAGARALQQAARLAEGPVAQARVKLAEAAQQEAIGHAANHRKRLFEAWSAIENQPDHPIAAEIALNLGLVELRGGRLQAADGWLDRARRVEHAALRAEVDLARAGLVLARGRLAEAEQILDAVHQQRDALPRRVAWEADVGRAHLLRRQGAFSEAVSLLESAIADARRRAAPASLASLQLALAACELDLARLGQAQDCIDDVLAALSAGERLHLRLQARLLQGRILLASGQLAASSYTLHEVVGQAERSAMPVLAEMARAALGEARWQLGSVSEGRSLSQAAFMGLLTTGHLEALADAVVARARAAGSGEDPSRAFKLVSRLTDDPSWRVLYLEKALAELRWHEARGEEPQRQQALQTARNALNRIAGQLTPTERATLRVHPWMRQLRHADAT